MLTFTKSQRKMTLVFIGIHVLVSLLTLLLYGMGHPLLTITKGFPVIVRVLLTSVLGFIIYAVLAYFAVLFKRTTEDIHSGIDRASVVLSLILTIMFILIYVLMFLPRPYPLWIAYTAINPLFGNMFFDSMLPNWESFLWIVSAFIPSLAMVFGMSLRLQHLEGKK